MTTCTLPRRVTASALALALVTVLHQPAHADPLDAQRRASSQTLYNEAVAEMDKGNVASACQKLEEVVKLEPTGLGAKLTLAQCYEKAGRLASAWAMYGVTEEGGLREKRADRWRPARKRKEALEPRLARLTLVVPSEVQALSELAIERDGVPVGSGQWGVAVPVDKGKHTIRVTASGKEPWERTIEIEEDGQKLEVAVETLGDAAPTAATKPPSEVPVEPPASSGSFWGPQRIAGVAVGTLGLAALGVGSYFGASALGKMSESDDGHCDGNSRCDPVGRQLRQDGRAAGDVSTVLFIAGGVVLAGGIVLFATAPSSKRTEVSLGLGSIQMNGTF
ncbi:hypothetical protein [Chondromyces crocatus]|uniref:PEGA domain-containing protein n=1 Tax=Chondromyces crocatus TaxID=52 RepID=A0A0K1EI54_CHOCO|nr:hypothetical protein [Chondromyces crocatus]AKT40540.1 uncharacterized protein CMC5_046950 [Chondromyces crocatus]